MGTDSIKTTGRESDKFMLRFPEGMRERIAAAAKEAGRSMNAEIISRLEGSVTTGPDLALALAEAQYEATKAAMHSEVRHAGFLALAELMEALLGRISNDKPLSLSTREKLKIRDLIDQARGDDPRGHLTPELLARMHAAAHQVTEARYRFLEGKGALNVRDAKV